MIGASTAIPVLMSPKFVDGMMLSDGALRQHLFAPAVPRETFGAGAQRRLIAVVNQDLVTEAPGACSREPGKVCNGVLPIASRVAGLAADQGLKDSLRAIESLARRPAGDGGPERLFETFYATAAEAVQACAEIRQQNCPPDSAGGSGGFCRVYMRCVADQGRVQGSHASGGNLPWRTFDALGIGSLPP